MERLSGFSELNKISTISVDGDWLIISNPWGDESLRLKLSQDDEAAFAALNAVYLPTWLSAIWHSDSQDLEIIYGSRQRDTGLAKRRFEYASHGIRYVCEFAPASERLLQIARIFEPLELSETAYRNLSAVRRSTGESVVNLRRRTGGDVSLQISGPLSEADVSSIFSKSKEFNRAELSVVQNKTVVSSFWIRNIDWDEDIVKDMITKLNFYMRYFDRQSPQIMIHEPSRAATVPRQLRYPHGEFPSIIVGRTIDPYLVQLWSIAETGNVFTKFLYSYQVLEYASFYYLQEETLGAVRRLLPRPDVVARSNDIASAILDIIVDDRLGDEQKINRVVQQRVSPEAIWPIVDAYRMQFVAASNFDGGMVVNGLIAEKWGAEDFITAWFPKLPDTLRRIRNGIVHAREARVSRHIVPNKKNAELLRPWSELMHEVAAQVMVFSAG